ncbi:hypothetical protein GCM10012279_53830 [Micromonospora yangpuensis]|nr:hypothetical protein GCM10012279_53830 [Micromonospora yangpuensis]
MLPGSRSVAATGSVAFGAVHGWGARVAVRFPTVPILPRCVNGARWASDPLPVGGTAGERAGG